MVERRKEEEMKLVRSKGVKRRKGIGDSLLSMDLLTMVDGRISRADAAFFRKWIG